VKAAMPCDESLLTELVQTARDVTFAFDRYVGLSPARVAILLKRSRCGECSQAELQRRNMAMHSLQRALCTLLALLRLAGCLLAPRPGQASETTGPTHFLPPARYHVGKLARLYRGQYILQSVARGARLSGAAIGIEVNARGDLYGVAQFYGYDA
jgi:hypothetical protein